MTLRASSLHAGAAGTLGLAAWGALQTSPTAGGWQHAALLLLVAPVLEEIIFRLGLQDALVRIGWPRWACVLLSASTFAAAHSWANPGSALAAATLLPGLVLAACYQHTRQLAPCVLLHAAMNALWLVATAAL